MMARLASPYRVFLVLMLFTLGVMSHDVTMAAEKIAATPGIEAHHMDSGMAMMDHGKDNRTCPCGHCDSQMPPCCLAGQCLIGVALPAPFAFLPAPRPVHVTVTLSLPTSNVRFTPFRPPAEV